MAGRHKEPIELVIAKGKKHLTKAEIDARRAGELDVPSDSIAPPPYLTKKQKDAFDEIAAQLIDLKIMTNLDCDALAAYIINRDLWTRAVKKLNSREVQSDIYLADQYSKMVSRNYKDMRSAASELGLSITSRGKIQIPESAKPAPVINKFAIFEGGSHG